MTTPLTVANDGEHVLLVYNDDETIVLGPDDAEYLANGLREAAESVRA